MNQKFYSQLVLLFILAVISLSFNCSMGPEETEEFKQTYKVAPDTNLVVHNINGNVNVSKWDNDYVDVYAIKSTRYGKNKLSKVKIEVTTNGDMVIESIYLQKNAKVSVNYTIRIPENIIANLIENSNGNIEIEGTKGDSVVNTSNGKIIVKNVEGYVSATSSNGKINIAGTTGVAKAETSNGSIRAEIANIKNNDINITTDNGSIELYVAPTLNADFEMKTSNGQISVHDIQLTVSKSYSEHLYGKLGTGGPKIYTKTSNGNIDLFKLSIMN